MKQLLFLLIVCLFSLPGKAAFSMHTTADSNYLHVEKLIVNLSNSNHPALTKEKSKLKKQNALRKVFTFFSKHNLFKPANKKSDFSLGGLLLGILLAPVGVAIAYLTTKNKKLRKWAVVGCITDIGLGMLLIFILIFVTTF